MYKILARDSTDVLVAGMAEGKGFLLDAFIGSKERLEGEYLLIYL